MSQSYNFSVGTSVVDDREIQSILQDNLGEDWIDYPALDNAVYFKLAKFTMRGRRFRAKYYDNYVFVRSESPIVPCASLSMKRFK